MDEPTTTKAFFGSFFQFTSTGCQELIASFQSSFTDASAVPFVGFGQNRNTFIIENVNEETELRFASHLKAFIENHTIGADDLDDTAKIIPIPCTWPLRDDADQHGNSVLDPGRLVEYDDASDSSSDNSSPIQYLTAYWNPERGNIDILSNDLAQSISDRTGCCMRPEPANRRVKIWNGKVSQALEMLTQLEPLMELQHRHLKGSASNLDSHILCLSKIGFPAFVQFRQISACSAADRVMVDQNLENIVERMQIGEQWNYNGLASRYYLAENLSNVGDQSTNLVGESKILDDVETDSIGDEAAMRTTLARLHINSGRLDDQNLARSKSSNQHSKYLGFQKQTQLAQWTQNVEAGVHPNVTDTVKPFRNVDDNEEKGEELTVHREVEQDSDSDAASNQDEDSFVQDHEVRRSILDESEDEVDRKLSKQKHYASSTPRSAFDSTSLQISVAQAESNNQPFKIWRTMPSRSRPEQAPLDHAAFYTEISTGTASQQRCHCAQPPCGPDERHTQPGSSGVEHRSVDAFRINDQSLSRNSALYSSHRSHTATASTDIGSASCDTNELDQRSLEAPSRCVRSGKRKSPDVQNDDSNRATPDRRSGQFLSHPTDNLINFGNQRNPPATVVVPPGFEIRDPPPQTTAIPVGIIDNPIENIRMPTLVPTADAKQQSGSESGSLSGNASLGTRRAYYGYNVQTKIPQINMKDAKQATVAHLLKSREDKKARPGTIKPDSEPLSPQRVTKHDEVRSRRFFNTMNLKAGNKSKKKASIQTESKKSREERIARAKAEAYGDHYGQAATDTPRGKESTSTSSSDRFSKRTQKAMKTNPEMAKLHANQLLQEACKEQAAKLVSVLKPILTAAYLHQGILSFEIQLGQLLVSASSDLVADYNYDEKQWQKIFTDIEIRPHTCFTDILTDNGKDIDRLLRIQNSNNELIWKRYQAGPIETYYEFECHQSNGGVFTIIMDSKGEYKICKARSALGKVGLHFAGQVWDGCAVLTSNYDAVTISQPTAELIEKFTSTIFIPAGKKSIVYSKLPLKSPFTVRSVIRRRVSIHDCLTEGLPDVQLKITEVKLLCTKRNEEDLELLCSMEKDFNEMRGDRRVHYHASLTHKEIEKDLRTRKVNNVQEILQMPSFNNNILSFGRLLPMLDLATQTIERIGWMGAENSGTVRLKFQRQLEKDEAFAKSLPPTALHSGSGNRAIHLPFNHNLASGSLHPDTRTSTVYDATRSVDSRCTPFVHGVRARTEAEMFIDDAGVPYRLGIGGARVPVVQSVGGSVTENEIMPNDSASQSGNLRGNFSQRSHKDAPGFW